jgi:hypothetical protein
MAHDGSMSNTNYAKKKRQAHDFYNTLGVVRCPALGNDLVHFTAEGFNHLVYKTAKKPRDIRVQMMKFDLLQKAKMLLEATTTFQEYEEEYRYIPVNRHGKFSHTNMLVRAWGFVAIICSFRIKVVVRQVGNGKKHFYSVIPAWVTRQYRGIKIIHNSPAGGVYDEHECDTLKNTTNRGVS